MYANLAPSAVGIAGLSLDETLALARRHGFGGIDFPAGDPAVAADPTAAGAKARDAGLRWGGFGLGLDFRGEEDAYRQGLDALPATAAAAERAGCDRCYTWLMPGHDTLDYRANFDRHAARLAPVARALADHGVRLGIEFVGPRTLRARFKHAFVHDINSALELAEAIGSDTGLLLDCFHWYTSEAGPGDVADKLRGKVVYVHVNDARAGRSPAEQIDHERALPGETGVIDLAGFMGELRRSGYDGPITAEPFLPELASLPPDEVAARVALSLKPLALSR